jgi:hypothetical protein
MTTKNGLLNRLWPKASFRHFTRICTGCIGRWRHHGQSQAFVWKTFKLDKNSWRPFLVCIERAQKITCGSEQAPRTYVARLHFVCYLNATQPWGLLVPKLVGPHCARPETIALSKKPPPPASDGYRDPRAAPPRAWEGSSLSLAISYSKRRPSCPGALGWIFGGGGRECSFRRSCVYF